MVIYYVFGLPARISGLMGTRPSGKDIFAPMPLASAIAGAISLVKSDEGTGR
jgi:hypothetical protein